MSRYIDADKLQEVFKELHGGKRSLLIDTEPTADVRENVRGEWLHEPYINNTWLQRCSNCFHVAMASCGEECPYNYCPKCGADMRGDKE